MSTWCESKQCVQWLIFRMRVCTFVPYDFALVDPCYTCFVCCINLIVSESILIQLIFEQRIKMIDDLWLRGFRVCYAIERGVGPLSHLLHLR